MSTIVKAISNLPDSTRQKYEDALQKHNFELEIFIPKNFDNCHQVKTNKNYLRNKLIQFNDNFKEEKVILQKLKKETSEFSNNYRLVTESNGVDPREKAYQTFNELIFKYKQKGYEENELLPKKNLFNPSILLKQNNKLDLIYMEKGYDEDKDVKYIKNTIDTLNGDKNFKKIQMNSFYQSGEETLLTLPKVLTKKQLKRENRSLYRSVVETERSIDKMNQEYKESRKQHYSNLTKSTDFTKTRTPGETISNIPFKPAEYSVPLKTTNIKIYGPKASVSTRNVFPRNSTLANSAGLNKSTKPIIKTVKSFKGLSQKKEGNVRNVKRLNTKTRKMMEDEKRKEELKDLYNFMKTSSFIACEKKAANYLTKYKKMKPEKVSSEIGSNLHGFTKDFKTKTTMTDLPELFHQFKVKTGSYDIKEGGMSKIKEIDDQIKGMEYDYAYELIQGK